MLLILILWNLLWLVVPIPPLIYLAELLHNLHNWHVTAGHLLPSERAIGLNVTCRDKPKHPTVTTIFDCLNTCLNTSFLVSTPVDHHLSPRLTTWLLNAESCLTSEPTALASSCTSR